MSILAVDVVRYLLSRTEITESEGFRILAEEIGGTVTITVTYRKPLPDEWIDIKIVPYQDVDKAAELSERCVR